MKFPLTWFSSVVFLMSCVGVFIGRRVSWRDFLQGQCWRKRRLDFWKLIFMISPLRLAWNWTLPSNVVSGNFSSSFLHSTLFSFREISISAEWNTYNIHNIFEREEWTMLSLLTHNQITFDLLLRSQTMRRRDKKPCVRSRDEISYETVSASFITIDDRFFSFSQNIIN
jgi:hypothetical protein